MDYQFIHDKISFLIEENHTNPYRLSQEMAYSGNYMNGILNKRKDFKISLLLKLCEHLNTTPAEFFEEDIAFPHREKYKELKSLTNELTDKDMDLLIDMAKRCACYNQSHIKYKRSAK